MCPAAVIAILALLGVGANYGWHKYTEGPMLFSENNLYGYKDADGNVLIPASYVETKKNGDADT